MEVDLHLILAHMRCLKLNIVCIPSGLRGGLKHWSGNSSWVQALAKLEACCVNIEKKVTTKH